MPSGMALGLRRTAVPSAWIFRENAQKQASWRTFAEVPLAVSAQRHGSRLVIADPGLAVHPGNFAACGVPFTESFHMRFLSGARVRSMSRRLLTLTSERPSPYRPLRPAF